jgi:hypothetical protein
MKAIGFQNSHSGTQNLNHADLVVNHLAEITIDAIENL